MNTLDLAPGETVRAIARVSFRGAAAVSARATFALGSARMRRLAYETWRRAADQVGLVSANPEMSLVCTDQRVLVCKRSFWRGRPSEVTGVVALTRLSDCVAVRHGIVVGVAFLFADGNVVEVEAMRGRSLRRFATAVREALAGHRP